MSFFTRLFAQSNPPHRLIAPHPRLKELRLMLMIFTVMFLVAVINIVIVRIIAEEMVFSWLPFRPPLFLMLIWLCYIGITLVIRYGWKRIELLRLAAAQEDQSLLADEQPQPNSDALHLPVTVAMRLPRGMLIVGSLILVIIGDTVILLLAWLEHLFNSFSWIWFLSLALCSGAIVMLVVFVMWRQRYLIEVSQEGIKSWVEGVGMKNSGVPLMFWHEVRLFSCYSSPDPWNKSSTMIYELSSTSQVVLWTWARGNRPLQIGKVPTIPFEEHQAQMRALCELIAAKTGLPLYDLSKGQVR